LTIIKIYLQRVSAPGNMPLYNA